MLKIGVVGAGIYGTYHIRTYLKEPMVERVVICDLDEKRLKEAENTYDIVGYKDIKEMIEKEALDAISIATSDPYHFIPLKEAIEAGVKNILVEKPLATSVEEAEQIIRLAEDYGTNIMIDFHKRWDPAYNNMKNTIEKDQIIRGYFSLDDIISVPKNWFSWADKSSPAWFLGVHCYDLIRYLTDSEVTSVYAVGNKNVLASSGVDTYDSIQAILSLADGSNWVVENSWVLPNSFPKSNDGQLVVITDKHYLKNESYRGVKTFGEKASLPNYIFMNFDENETSGFGLEPMKAFVNSILQKKPFPCDVTDGLMATRIAAAVHESLETEDIITLSK